MADNWGGTREGAGRKKKDNPKQTVVIRVDIALLPIINELKTCHKEGRGVDNLLSVTDNQDTYSQDKVKDHEALKMLKVELEKFKKTNLDLVLQKDKIHLQTVSFKTKINALQSNNKRLKSQLDALRHKEYDCMVLKKDGSRCTRPARTKINWHGVEIKACLQHSKIK